MDMKMIDLQQTSSGIPSHHRVQGDALNAHPVWLYAGEGLIFKRRSRWLNKFWVIKAPDVMVEDQPQKDGLQKQTMHRKSLIILSLWIGIFTCSGVSLSAPATDLRTLLPNRHLPHG